jgi:hypothetical protein
MRAFKGGFTLGATVCFLVTVANVPSSRSERRSGCADQVGRVLGAGALGFQAVAGRSPV